MALQKKLKIQLPYAPAILILGLKAGTQVDICTPMFIAALFTIAKGRSNSSAHRQTMGKQNVISIHTMEYYSALKRRKSCYL